MGVGTRSAIKPGFLSSQAESAFHQGVWESLLYLEGQKTRLDYDPEGPGVDVRAPDEACPQSTQQLPGSVCSSVVMLWLHGTFFGPVSFNLLKCTNIHINSSPSACCSGLLKSTKRTSNLGSRWRRTRLINACAAQRFGDLEEKITLARKQLKRS